MLVNPFIPVRVEKLTTKPFPRAFSKEPTPAPSDLLT